MGKKTTELKPIIITYDFLFNDYENEELKDKRVHHPVRTDKGNSLYGKEIYVRPIKGDRDVLFQSLGYIGAYANNYYDSTIHFVLLSDETVELLRNGTRDEHIRWAEQECERQRASWKDPKKWKFRMRFIVEGEVIDFMRGEFDFRNEEAGLNLISKYHDK